MSKKVKAIIAGSIVMVLLVGAVIALVLTNNPATEDEQTSSIGAELITIQEASVDDLEYILVKNQKDEYKIESIGEKKFGIKEIDGYKQVDGMFETTASSVMNIYAQQIIEENATDLDMYGFDNPTLEAEIKVRGKDSLKLTLGNLSPDTYTRYMIKTGENTVYGMSSGTLSNLMSTKYDYLDKVVVPALETGEDGNPVAPSLERIEIQNELLEKPVIMEKYQEGELSKNGFPGIGVKMTSPINGMINETKAQERINPVFGLTASSIAAINPTAAQLTEYGFDTPTSSFSINYDKTFSAKVITGSAIECQHEEGEDLTDHKHVIKSYYAMREGTNVIYVVPKESLSWLDIKRNTLLSSIAVLPPILDLDGVDFTVGSEKYEIKYKMIGDDEDDTNEMEATVNGKSVDIDAAKKMLQLFYATSIQDVNTGITPENPPDASLVYHYKGGKTDKVEFFIMDDRQVVISLNGNLGYTGRSGYIEVMQKNMNKLINGEEVDTDW